jgi:hypothetical protein
MRVILNPDQLVAAYEFIRTLEPFNLWALTEKRKDFPHADEIEFRIVGDRRSWAWKQRKFDGSHIIAYSDKAPAQATFLIMYMAHEMVHLYQDINKLENSSMHNRDFVARAKQICSIQGYDLQMFL